MKEKIFSGKLKAGVFLMFTLGVCVMTITAIMIFNKPKSWHVVSEFTPLGPLGEGNPGAGAGGILEIFFYPHSGTPGTTYAENDSSVLEVASLAWADADDFNKEIVHSTDFDVVVRVRGNQTQCWRTDKWFDSDLRVRWTCADLGVSADTEMTGVITQNNTGESYLWMNFYDATSFSLDKDETVTISSIKFEAYY